MLGPKPLNPKPGEQEMSFLYHMVPDPPVRGGVLRPLSALQSEADLYERHMRKYEGRDWVSDIVIPVLQCGWHDVLFFSAVHPQKICNGLRQAGLQPGPLRAFEVRASLLSPARTAILPGEAQARNVLEYLPYDPDDVVLYAEVPERTVEYYRRRWAARKPPLLFHGVAQFLYKGAFNITGLTVVEGR